MKRILVLVLSVLMLISVLSGTAVQAEERVNSVEPISINSLQIGDYVRLGQYDDEPIVWRFMDEDAHGKLMVSDKILCEKPYGETNFWKESFIRMWLNSDVSEGEVDWSPYVSKWADSYMALNEKGFLHDSNFNALEKKVLKSVVQWTMLPQDRLTLTENGITTTFTAIKKTIPGSPQDGGGMTFYTIPELPDAYVGAAYEVTDTMFLLDEMQIYHIWNTFGDAKAQIRRKFWDEIAWLNTGGYYSYYLRTPTNNMNTQIGWETEYLRKEGSTGGIRPAFYLDEDNAVILSGSGTTEDPYVVTGRDIQVKVNGTEAEFDQEPVVKGETVMIPLRVVFEMLGGKVVWEEETQTITIEKADRQVKLNVDMQEMYVGDQMVWLPSPVILRNDRTLVPLQVLTAGFGISAEWDSDAQKVTISDQ